MNCGERMKAEQAWADTSLPKLLGLSREESEEMRLSIEALLKLSLSTSKAHDEPQEAD